MSPTHSLLALFVLTVGADAKKAPFPDNSDLKWHKDLSHSLKAGQFIRLSQTILTKFPLFLRNGGGAAGPDPEPAFGTLPVAEGIGDRKVTGNVLLNTYVGNAHAYCYGLQVQQAVNDYAFRVCTSTEMQALTSVTKLPGNTAALTYSSAGGDDFTIGLISDEPYRFILPPDQFANGRNYDEFVSGVPAPPSFPPSPPLPVQSSANRMQTFSGDEHATFLWNADAYINVVAYCCSGKYTRTNGQGIGDD